MRVLLANLSNFQSNVLHCLNIYLSQFFLSIPENGLSHIDSQDVSDEGSDQALKILYESYGNYIDISNVSNDELIIRSKDGENFTYLVNIEETQKLNSGASVYSLSDDPQNTIHIECK